MAYVDKILKAGDRVVMEMSDESRSYYGDSYPPNGTLGTFKGRRRRTIHRARFGLDPYFYKPGIYELDGAAIIEWDNGSTAVDGWSHDMVDKEEYARRREAFAIASKDQDPDFGDNPVRIGDLPETKFWEGDIVRFVNSDFSSHQPNRLRVYLIQYEWQRDDRGIPYQVEWVDENNEYARSGHTYAHDADLELIERGNLWREFHNEPLVFNSLLQKVAYEKNRGRYKEVRNPATDLYKWTLEEALQAIREGIADGLTVSTFLNFDPRTSLFKLTNREIGEEVRAATLAGFIQTAAETIINERESL